MLRTIRDQAARISGRANWELAIGGFGLSGLAVVVLLLALASEVEHLWSRHALHPGAAVAGLLAGGGALVAGAERLRARRMAALANGAAALGITAWYGAGLLARQGVLAAVPSPLGWCAVLAAVTLGSVVVALRARSPAVLVLALLGGHATPVLALAGPLWGRTVLVHLLFLNAAVLTAAGLRRWTWIRPLVVWGTVATVAYGWRSWLPHAGPAGVAPLLVLHWLLVVAATLGPVVSAGRAASWLDPMALAHAGGGLFAALWLLDQGRATGLWALGLAAAHAALGGLVRWGGRKHARLACTLAGMSAVFVTIALALQLSRDYVGVAWCAQGLALNLVGVWTRGPRVRSGAAGVALLGGGWMLVHNTAASAAGVAAPLGLAALGVVLLGGHALSLVGTWRRGATASDRRAAWLVALAAYALGGVAVTRLLPPAASLPAAAAAALAWTALAEWMAGAGGFWLGLIGLGLAIGRWLAWSATRLMAPAGAAGLDPHFGVALVVAGLGGGSALGIARRRPALGSVVAITAWVLVLAGWQCQVRGPALILAWAGVGTLLALAGGRWTWRGGAVLSLGTAVAATAGWVRGAASLASQGDRAPADLWVMAGWSALVLAGWSAHLLRRIAIRLPRDWSARRRWTWRPSPTLGLLANSVGVAIAGMRLADCPGLVIQTLDLGAVWAWGFLRGRASGRWYALAVAVGLVGPRLVLRDLLAVGMAQPLAPWRDPALIGVGFFGLVLLAAGAGYARARRLSPLERPWAILCPVLGHLVLVAALTGQLDAGFDQLEAPDVPAGPQAVRSAAGRAHEQRAARGTVARLEMARIVGYSVLWTAYAAVLIGAGVGLGHRPTRLLGMALLVPVVLKIAWIDGPGLGLRNRVVCFTAVGSGMALISSLYLRARGPRKGRRARGTG